jgi:hypothetical protein
MDLRESSVGHWASRHAAFKWEHTDFLMQDILQCSQRQHTDRPFTSDGLVTKKDTEMGQRRRKTQIQYHKNKDAINHLTAQSGHNSSHTACLFPTCIQALRTVKASYNHMRIDENIQ